MEIFPFFKGIVLGFCISMPVGPIGLLCIRRTLNYGHLSGLFSGLGAALADTLYGTLAAFGITLISDFVLHNRFWFGILGSIALLLIGIMTYHKKVQTTKPTTHKTLIKDIFSTFFLTLSNPVALIAFIAVFASLGAELEPENAPLLSVGIFLGAIFWWLILTTGVSFFRAKMNEHAMVWVNRIAGVILATFGVVLFVLSLNLS